MCTPAASGSSSAVGKSVAGYVVGREGLSNFKRGSFKVKMGVGTRTLLGHQEASEKSRKYFYILADILYWGYFLTELKILLTIRRDTSEGLSSTAKCHKGLHMAMELLHQAGSKVQCNYYIKECLFRSKSHCVQWS